MRTRGLPTLARSVAVITALCSCAASLAQTEDADQELEVIIIEEHYGDEESAFGDDNQGYRLIEDEAEDDWIEPMPRRESAEDELQRLYGLYVESLEDSAYLEADTLAKRVVELSIRINGIDSRDSARAITNLAIAQHHNRDFESAQRNFVASIDIIERIDDRLSKWLINPLRGLAATQVATGQPDLAKQSFQRAVHVSHVNDGPHNQSQVATLEAMSELHISMGDFEEAIDLQENVFAIQARNVDPNSMDMLPALEKQAHWQHRLQMYHRERLSWRRIIHVIEKNNGKEDLRLIPPLTSLGKSYLYVSPTQVEFQPQASAGSGEAYLRRANRIADVNPDSDWERVEETLLALGDYYILSGRPNRAGRAYKEAWSLLAEEDDQQRKYRRDHLENLNVLQKIYVPKYYDSERAESGPVEAENFLSGSVSFSYTVLATGRITGIRHLETQPPQLIDIRNVVASKLRRLIYRPRVDSGTLVGRRDVVYTHDFFYKLSDLPTAVEEENEEATTEQPTR
jgi:hypothetical protein